MANSILAISSWSGFWSMGQGAGTPSMALSIQALLETGYEVRLLLPTTDRIQAAAAPGEENGVIVRRFWVPYLDPPRSDDPWRVFKRLRRSVRFTHGAARALRQEIRENRPKVVISHGALPAPAVWWVTRRFSAVSTVVRLYGMTATLNLHRRLRFYMAFEEIAALKLSANAWIVVNDGSCGDRVARRLGVPMDRFHFWINGQNPEDWADPGNRVELRREWGISADAPVISTIGGLYEERRVERVIEVLALVRRRLPNAHLWVVGDGVQRGFLEALSRELGLSEWVHFTGAVSRTQVPGFFHASDLYLTLSDCRNAGNTLFESMLCDCPIVALNTRGMEEFVIDGVTGYLVPLTPLDPAADRVHSILTDRGHAKALARNARSWANENIPTVAERKRLEAQAVARAIDQVSQAPS